MISIKDDVVIFTMLVASHFHTPIIIYYHINLSYHHHYRHLTIMSDVVTGSNS